MGAWIETKQNREACYFEKVAPRVGAWIETCVYIFMLDSANMSHPVWVRGLKLKSTKQRGEEALSHPVWVRGLKQRLGQ